MKHAIEIKMAIELAKMISNEYSENLLKIFIINETWHIKFVYYTLLPFLRDRVKKIIHFSGEVDVNDNCIDKILLKYWKEEKT
jgi:hypothetical protein